MNLRNDEYFMRLALKEAKKGIGKTSPNPCVGAVIVKDGEVIARGYHKKAGTPHAEIHALTAAGENASGATIYVTLEPCNHTGKTPPCSHAVARAGIVRVVVGMEDPNPLVDGTGITYLKSKNIEVVSGVLESECYAINRPFIKHISTGLPWIVMKAGISLDGKLNYQEGSSGWITGPESSEKVHKLRNTYDAILVGSNTARIDNPSLTTRLRRKAGKDPVRVILDKKLSLSSGSKVFTLHSDAQTWVFCSNDIDQAKKEELIAHGVRVEHVDCIGAKLNLLQIFQRLGSNGVNSVLVEGGAGIHGAMIHYKLYDYANLFIAPVFAGEKGISLLSGYETDNKDNAVSLKDVKYTRFGQDIMVEGAVVYPAL